MDQINSKYLENYASQYASEVCKKFFTGKQFISGQDIVSLTNSTQVNFFVLKELFSQWQDELEKLKSNPYFDYRDITVHDALTNFMNILSKRIKVEKSDFQPLLESATKAAIQVATDPVSYFKAEIERAPKDHINEYLKDNQKYYKWHVPVISFLIDKAGFGLEKEPYLKAIAANYQVIKDDLESQNLLLATLGDVAPFDLDAYLGSDSSGLDTSSGESFFDSVGKTETVASPAVEEKVGEEPLPEIKEEEPSAEPEPIQEQPAISNPSGKLNAAELKRQFEVESYPGMKSVVSSLAESLAINQRFMFTKELFEGNSDLLMHALKKIDASNGFEEAVNYIDARYVEEMNWDINSDPVQEFLRLIYQRFEN